MDLLRRLLLVALLASIPLAASTVPGKAEAVPATELIQPAQYYGGYYRRPYYHRFYRPYYRPYYYGPRFYRPYYHRRFYRPY